MLRREILSKQGGEHPVPEVFRPTFRQIVDAFIAGDFELRDHLVGGVRPILPDTANWIAENIADYGEALAPLDDETWELSIYRWMDDYWQFLVDLTTTDDPVSDLTLHAKLYDNWDEAAMVVEAVYVP